MTLVKICKSLPMFCQLVKNGLLVAVLGSVFFSHIAYADSCSDQVFDACRPMETQRDDILNDCRDIRRTVESVINECSTANCRSVHLLNDARSYFYACEENAPYSGSCWHALTSSCDQRIYKAERFSDQLQGMIDQYNNGIRSVQSFKRNNSN